MDRAVAPKVSSGLIDLNSVEIETLIENITPKHELLNHYSNIYYFGNPQMELIRIDLIFDAGIVMQKEPIVAAMTLDLLKYGTLKYSAADIANVMDYYGAILETRIDMEHSVVSLFALSQHIDKLLPILRDIVSAPAFLESEINIRREQMVQKFRVNSQKTAFLAKRNLNNMIFGNGHPLGVLTSEADYYNLNRDKLVSFFNANYKGFDIVVSGNITPQVLTSIKSTFDFSMPKAGSITPPIFSSSQRLKCVEKEGSLHSTISMGGITIAPTHQDFALLSILTTILGGYFGSRLMSNIREDKGYTYGIGARIMSMRQHSILILSSDVEINSTQDALDEIWKEILVLQNEPISNEELHTVISYISGQIMRCIDGTFQIADNFISYLNLGLELSSISKQIEIMKTVTPEQLLNAAKRYYNTDNIYTSIVGSCSVNNPS